MNNVLNLMPRIRAKQAAQEDCSHFYDDMVFSGKALDRITREIYRLNNKPIGFECAKYLWSKEDVRQDED